MGSSRNFVSKSLVIVYVSIVFILTSCVSTSIKNYHFNQKQSAEKLKEDVVLLKKILEANHPSLYWYTSKDTIDYYFEKALQNIQDSLKETEFRNVVAAAISKIQCGHTGVRFSKNYTKAIDKNKYPQFPLFFKVWDDSLVILANTNVKDSILKRGVRVTSINGKSNRETIDKIFAVMSTDGYSNNFKNQILSNNFPAWYKLVWGLDSIYRIAYLDSLGNEHITLVKIFSPLKDTTKKVKSAKTTEPKPVTISISRRDKKMLKLLSKRSMQIDTSINTAYIKLNTFSSGRLRKFFRQSFKKIKNENISNVVIDLRENGGGNVAISTLLSKYIVSKPFKLGDTVKAVSRKFAYKKHMQKWGVYWFAMNFFARKEKDGFIHFRHFEKHYYKPKKKNHFDGNVYIVQGGYTFSASTMFISNIKSEKNVTLLGEETGGGFYGNSAMHLPIIVLPNSKLRVVLPIYRLVMDKTRPKGRGIFPDIKIPPSSIGIRKGYDVKLVELRKLIIERNKQ